MKITIEKLGQKGEGIAPGPVYVPYALPGDVIEADVKGPRGRLVKLLQPGKDRIEPVCAHYGVCGGCAVQALGVQAYMAWKQGLVADALKFHRVETDLRPLQDVHGAGRRRVTFHARIENGRAHVGFMQARSHDLVEIDTCPLLAPELGEALPVARALAQALAHRGKPMDLVISATMNGLDVDLRGLGPLGPPDMQKLTRLTQQLDLARLSNHGAIVLEQRPPVLQMGAAQVVPPAGAFLQATLAAEEALAGAVLDAVNGAKRVADLFCGVGTFALRLAQHARVLAAESDAAALQALVQAARNPALQQVDPIRRDLFTRPLQAEELNGCEAVVFDPPRAGAQAQVRELAKSEVPLVVGVSCNVQSFAEDAKTLIAGGFVLESVTPFDQFRHSPHIELVGVFRRPPQRKKRRLLG